MSGPDGYGDDDDGTSQVTCPACSETIDAHELWEHNQGGSEDSSNCPACGESSPDEEWS